MMLVGTHGHGLGWLSLLSDFKYPVLSNSTLYYNLVCGLGPAPSINAYTFVTCRPRDMTMYGIAAVIPILQVQVQDCKCK